jgi:hypothetical protein
LKRSTDLITRTFTREQLDEWDLPWGSDDVEILQDEQIETRRWYSVHEVVFRAPDDGKTWAVTYEQGLTEHQEDHDLWGYENTVEGELMELVEEVTTKWKAVRTDG